jgi:DNA-binding MarR family transcriptional regulator
MAKIAKANEAAVSELLAAMGQLMRRLRAEAESGELSWTQIAITSRLDTGPMTTADLARAESMKPQSMGASLAQLEEEGVVRRKPDPNDGRQILFELTAAGVEGRYRFRLAKREWLLAAIAKLERDEQQTLFAATDVIKRLAESDM